MATAKIDARANVGMDEDEERRKPLGTLAVRLTRLGQVPGARIAAGVLGGLHARGCGSSGAAGRPDV